MNFLQRTSNQSDDDKGEWFNVELEQRMKLNLRLLDFNYPSGLIMTKILLSYEVIMPWFGYGELKQFLATTTCNCTLQFDLSQWIQFFWYVFFSCVSI